MRRKMESVISQSFRYLLFFSSYLPLFVIVFLINIKNSILSLFLMGLIVITLLTLKWYLDIPLKSIPNEKVKIVTFKSNGSEILNYIVTYIIPFISFNGNIFGASAEVNTPSLIAFIILFVVIGNLYMQNNLYHINPIITIFYEIYTATDSYGKNIIIISNKNINLPTDETIYMRNVSPGIKLHTKDDKNKLSYTKMIVFTVLLIMALLTWNVECREFAEQLIFSIMRR